MRWDGINPVQMFKVGSALYYSVAELGPVPIWPWNSTVCYRPVPIRPRNNTVRYQPWTSIQDLFHPNSWQTPVAAVTVYSVPDGHKGRPKHVEHTCSF